MSDKRVVTMINSLAGGGAERVVTTLLNELINECECYLIVLENIIEYEIDNRVKIISLNESVKQNGLVKFMRLMITSYKLSKIIKKHKFKQIASFLYRANYINILSNIFAKHNTIISERIAPSSMYIDSSLTSKISKFLIKKLYKKANLIVPVSIAIKHDLQNSFGIIVQQKVIYNPYNIEKINYLSKIPLNLDIGNREKNIISVGSLNPRKNYDLLLKAFSKISHTSVKLYILGKGSEEQNLKQLAKDLDIEKEVIFLGFDNNPYKFLSRCSIFVLSSKSEGFPNVLAEAMICGCAVISTDCLSGPREILAPNSNINFTLKDNIEMAEYGILTPINDSENLAKAINLMIEDKNLMDNYGKKAVLRAKDFDIKNIITEYKKVLICAE
ncbi:glycosyltransferase [Campylobacter curvus]|uniref:glycosyltransferase n=1 Tax=Campylobacter curvus TaxID=200 RepID=UPI00146FE51C|nr:glycosyltransferase [Campylobacter curvus]